MNFTVFLSIGCLITLLGFALIIGGIVSYVNQQRRNAQRVPAGGTVIELVQQVMNAGSASDYFPVVEFKTPSGETVRFESDFGSRPAGYRVGQSVQILYDASNPQKAEIQSWLSRWLTVIILGFMGSIALCIGVTFMLVSFLSSGLISK